MSNLIALFVVFTAFGMLMGYYLGYSAGQKEGYDRGHREGKQSGSVRAFAVGYDRGRHDREAKEQQAQPPPPQGLRWRPLVGAIVLAVSLLTLVSILRGNGFDFASFLRR